MPDAEVVIDPTLDDTIRIVLPPGRMRPLSWLQPLLEAIPDDQPVEIFQQADTEGGYATDLVDTTGDPVDGEAEIAPIVGAIGRVAAMKLAEKAAEKIGDRLGGWLSDKASEKWGEKAEKNRHRRGGAHKAD